MEIRPLQPYDFGEVLTYSWLSWPILEAKFVDIQFLPNDSNFNAVCIMESLWIYFLFV